MSKTRFLIILITLLTSCAHRPIHLKSDPKIKPTKGVSPKVISNKPKKWGTNLEGILTNIKTKRKIMALTFDACDNFAGTDYELINYLIENKIRATLFVSYKWIKHNRELLKKISALNFFQIENHGFTHRPLSVNGASAYGIRGTNSYLEVKNEVLENSRQIASITGINPQLFRSGTAHYDEMSIKILKDMKVKPIGFSINGDGGGKYSGDQLYSALTSNPRPGDIVIMHMNKPSASRLKGFKSAIEKLKSEKFEFVLLRNLSTPKFNNN